MSHLEDEMARQHDDLPDLRPLFISEARQHLGVLEETLVGMEGRQVDGQDLSRALRSMHTIKGSAGLLGLDAVAAVAHVSEDVLAALHSRRVAVDGACVSLLLRATDAISKMVEVVESEGTPALGPFENLVSELSSWEGRAPAEGDPVPVSEPSEHTRSDEPMPALRVGIPKLDELVDAVNGALMERRSLKARLRDASDAPDWLVTVLEDGERALVDLRETVMSMRLVPIDVVFRRFVRPVRDMAADSGKQARLTTTGGDVEVDTGIAEALIEPLTHLVRNAVDHGLEPPERRVAAGKPARGTITLSARHDAAGVVIEVTDDGAGLSLTKVASRARQVGLVGSDDLTESELHELIFQPGFSTADRVSDVSGRGVGMEIVRRTIEGLRGSVHVASRPGPGTTFSLHVPLTVAVMEGLRVSVDDVVYVVPLDNVIECAEAPSIADHEVGSGLIQRRGSTLPYARLRHVLQRGGRARGPERMLVVRHGARSVGLLVDRLVGVGETVVRPLDPRVGSRLSGTAMLEDGRLALIVDVPKILADFGTSPIPPSGSNLN